MQSKQLGKTGLIVTALLVLAGLIFLFGTQTGKDLRSGAGEVADKAGQMAEDAAEATIDAGASAVDATKDAAAATADAGAAALDKAGDVAGAAVDATKDVATATGNMVKDAADATADAGAAAIDKAGDVISDTASNVSPGTDSYLGGFADSAKKTLKADASCQAIVSVLDGIVSSVNNGSVDEADGLAKIKETMQENKACIK